MSYPHLAQLASGLLVAVTPWIVLRIVLSVASRHARVVGQAFPVPRTVAQLGYATVVAVPVVGGLALGLPAPSGWMAVVSGLAFATLATLALRALHDLDAATRPARHVESTVRVATLVRRRSRQYLPMYWRGLPFGVTVAGLALFVSRMTAPSPVDRRVLVPVGFALAAPVFLWLYEVWIWNIVTGPAVPDANDRDRWRRQSVRTVFAVELVLVVGFLALANTLVDLDWSKSAVWPTIATTCGGLLGVCGCALAIASELSTRRYLPADADGRADKPARAVVPRSP